MKPKSYLTALWLLCLVIPGTSVAFEAPGYGDPEEAVERILTPLISNDRPAFHKSMNHHFGEGGNQIDALVFDTFLTEGEVFEYFDELQREALGETLKRFVYALRTSKSDFLFLRIHTANGQRGWIVYNLEVKDDLSDLFLGWDNP